MVGKMPNGTYWCSDEIKEWVPDTSTKLKTVFRDGGNVGFFEHFIDIRRRMYG